MIIDFGSKSLKYDQNQMLCIVINEFLIKWENYLDLLEKATDSSSILNIYDQLLKDNISFHRQAMKTHNPLDFIIASSSNLTLFVFAYVMLEISEVSDEKAITHYVDLLEKLNKCKNLYEITKISFIECGYAVEELDFQLNQSHKDQ